MTLGRAPLLRAILAVATSAAAVGGQRADLPKAASARSALTLPTLTLRGHERWASCVAFSPDGKRIVSGSADDTLKVWDARTGQELLRLVAQGKGITCVARSQDGTRIAAGCWNSTLRIWDSVSGKELASLRGHKENVTSVAFSPDGRRLVSGSGDDTMNFPSPPVLRGRGVGERGFSIPRDMQNFVCESCPRAA